MKAATCEVQGLQAALAIQLVPMGPSNTVHNMRLAGQANHLRGLETCTLRAYFVSLAVSALALLGRPAAAAAAAGLTSLQLEGMLLSLGAPTQALVRRRWHCSCRCTLGNSGLWVEHCSSLSLSQMQHAISSDQCASRSPQPCTKHQQQQQPRASCALLQCQQH